MNHDIYANQGDNSNGSEGALIMSPSVSQGR